MTFQPVRWHKCQSYCVQSLCQAGIWSVENIMSENIISENNISSTCIKNFDEIIIANLKTHKTAKPSWADTFRVCKSTTFLAVLNKGILVVESTEQRYILVESWQIWSSDQMKELTNPWRALKTDPTRIKLKLAGWTRIPIFLSPSEKWKST